jgi:hypothetical protein
MEPITSAATLRRGGPSRPPAPALVRFSQLSGARQALVRLCQAVNYGYIQALDVKDSEPVLDPSPLAFMNVNLGSDHAPRPEADLSDFELRHEFCRLLANLDQIRNGTIHHVQIRGGLPTRIVVDARLVPA